MGVEFIRRVEGEESRRDGECCFASLWVEGRGECPLGSTEALFLNVVGQFQEIKRNKISNNRPRPFARSSFNT